MSQTIQLLCLHHLFKSKQLLGHSLYLAIIMYIVTGIHEWTWADRVFPTIMLAWAKYLNAIELREILVLRVAWKSFLFSSRGKMACVDSYFSNIPSLRHQEVAEMVSLPLLTICYLSISPKPQETGVGERWVERWVVLENSPLLEGVDFTFCQIKFIF